jgi:hypothetical protein
VALVTAVLDLGVTAQLAAWLAASLLFIVLWFRVFRPERHKTRIGMSEPAMIGEVGLLAHDVAPFEKGEVRFQKPLLGSDCWPCIADEPIRAGERVKVVTVEGSILKVAKV